jgi:hypothetical protein
MVLGLFIHPVLSQEKFSYKNYRYVLLNYVNRQGLVNYSKLKDYNSKFTEFINSLSLLTEEEYENWTDKEKIAFWINGYNALTLKVIADNYPVKSIRKIKGAWDKIEFTVKGQQLTLDDIEHKILRIKFNEPGIHMALVCAAMGCPKLRKQPYKGDILEYQLSNQAKNFLYNDRKFRINRIDKIVYLSPIFKWFGEDFINRYGNGTKIVKNRKLNAVLNYIKLHLKKKERKFIEKGDYKVKYLRYDWSLNEQQP